MEVLSRLQGIFREIFDDETLILTKETSQGDIEGWDSLAQVNIVVACEVEFKIKFYMDDIVKFKNVGSIVDMVEGKI